MRIHVSVGLYMHLVFFFTSPHLRVKHISLCQSNRVLILSMQVILFLAIPHSYLRPLNHSHKRRIFSIMYVPVPLLGIIYLLDGWAKTSILLTFFCSWKLMRFSFFCMCYGQQLILMNIILKVDSMVPLCTFLYLCYLNGHQFGNK